MTQHQNDHIKVFAGKKSISNRVSQFCDHEKPIPLSTYIKTSFYLDKKEEINFYANIHTDQRKVYIRMYVLCSGKYDTYYIVIDFFRIYHIVHRNFRYDISNSSLVIFFKFNIRLTLFLSYAQVIKLKLFIIQYRSWNSTFCK